MHRARGAPARARASREGRRDESTVNNSGSKLKIYEIHPVGNHLLFRSMRRATCESKYARRKVENNNDPKSPDLVAYPPVGTAVYTAVTLARVLNLVLNLV